MNNSQIFDKSHNNILTTRITLVLLVIFLTIYGSGEFKVPSFSINVAVKYIILTFGLFFSVFFIKVKKFSIIKLDIISQLLLIHLLYNTIIIVLNSFDNYVLSYFTYVFAFLGYLWGSNSLIDTKTFKIFLSSFYYILIIQTLFTVYIVSHSVVDMYLFKNGIVIPIGASNGITTFIVMIFPILYKLSNSRTSQYFLTIFTMIFAVLSRSNSGLLTIIAIILILFMQEKKYKLIRGILIFLTFLLFLYLIGKYSPGYLSRFSSTLQLLITDQSTNQTKAMNGRIEVFHSALYKIKNHFFIGNGFGYRERMPSYLMTHNWLLEYLITGGIISFLLKIFIFILQFLKLVTVKNSALKQGLIISFVFVLIQGLVEPSFGSPLFELIFALIIGFGTNTLYEEKNIYD